MNKSKYIVYIDPKVTSMTMVTLCQKDMSAISHISVQTPINTPYNEHKLFSDLSISANKLNRCKQIGLSPVIKEYQHKIQPKKKWWPTLQNNRNNWIWWV